MAVQIRGTGSCVPEKILENRELEQMVETADAWIRERTGICRRHIAGKETVVDMGTKAAMQALQRSGISAQEIDLLIVSTLSAETVMPSVSCRIQERIGAQRAVCFDLNAACSGFLLAYQSAEAYLESGFCKTALIIGGERLSDIVDWADRNSCILFGDGAGAVVLTGIAKKGYRFISHSDGSMGNALVLERRYDRNLKTEQESPDRNKDAASKVRMDGQAVFRFAVRKVPQVIEEVLLANGLSGQEIDCYVLHQANRRIVEAVARRLGEPLEKFPMNLQNYGNTSSASIPILLNELDQSNRLKTGDRIVMAGFGGGLTWGASIVEWISSKRKKETSIMFEEIKAIVAENLGADKASITPETSFLEDLKADSLDLFEMVMAFEEHFGVEIPAEDLEQLKTVGDVASYVESHKA